MGGAGSFELISNFPAIIYGGQFVNAKSIGAEQIARAAAEGVAIALAARNVAEDLEFGGPIVAGQFPDALFEVSLQRDEVTGAVQVRGIQPYQSGQ
ncbi:hypothetical protein AB0D27_22470 [Streptomyces sp. NPDC048415]|uniref:hypothetical protein n=1 Tax=Streptomyces sp. NPDC048415 TaxID=3154822 RepID=UPI003445265D